MKMAVTKASIEKKVWNLCLCKKKHKDYPAAVVGAILHNSWAVAENGLPSPPIAIQLKNRLEGRLGRLGTILSGNPIGMCAEVGAANKILRTRPTVSANKLIFTTAIRPRTMQKVPMCLNCLTTFR